MATFEELQVMFRDETLDTILVHLYKRGKACGIDGLRVVSAKQLTNAIDKLEGAKMVTENDLLTYQYGDYTFFRTPEFRQLVVSKRS